MTSGEKVKTTEFIKGENRIKSKEKRKSEENIKK